MALPVFRFTARWREELVVTGPGGSFILELPMGVLTACLPSEAAWPTVAPAWAKDLWPVLRTELESWCLSNNANLEIDDSARVWPFYGALTVLMDGIWPRLLVGLVAVSMLLAGAWFILSDKLF